MPSSKQPKYAQIKADLRLQILQGAFTPGQPFVTQQQICDLYAVSMLTAARALNELEFEGLVTRQRGRGTFVAELRAPAKVGESKSIMCIVPGLTSGHVANVVRGIESVCDSRDYQLVLADSHGSEERQSRSLQRAAAGEVAGVIIYPVEGAADEESIAQLRAANVPIVFADRYWPDIPADAVILDDFAIGYELTRKLIARGHRSIGTVWGEVACTSVRDRLAGHLRALREHELPVIGELTALRPYLPASASAGTSVLKRMFTGTVPPTALLCANGFVLASAMNELAEWGADGAEPVELAGMDEAGPYDTLPLTVASAALPSTEMGSRAAEILLGRLGAPSVSDDTAHIVLPVEIHVRDVPAVLIQA
ncbi:GntR family transcriptional regulator [Subtercola vilae]|uniref:GntR family transcriptional regulator n=1 Tax=Subtercola vilae TaxID=2056433 RepID=A0A4T2BXG7_9MICO|nr:GntR family transcriptional regulator [Subtercola vilae]TIH36643.1 GntR family transcriptional regulator [Subtercola vilae]